MAPSPFRRDFALATVDKVTVVTGLFRRARTQAIARRVALSMSAIVVAGSMAAAPAMASPGAPGPDTPQSVPSGTAIDATQAQVDAVEAQFAAEQQSLAQLSEQYDQANVRLGQIDAQLSATDARLALARKKHAAARHELQVAAVNAYIFDTPSSQLASMFSTPSETSAIHDEYQQTALGNINGAVVQLESSERQLNATESTLHTELNQAAGVSTQVGAAQQAARATSNATQATLTQVKGHLAQLVAQRAAQQAAVAAADAVAAANEAARERAAAAAAQAAQVAETFGAGSAAAVQAANAANQAAASAGAAGVIGSGSPQTATGAGALALRGAESFLGVPYEWGGASAGGLDCSGLTMLAWRNAGVDLLHSADIQYSESAHIPLSQVRPGDLLFYDLDGGGIDHVVMYVGSGLYGADTIIQAAHSGTVVEFDPVWFLGLVGAGRP
jgi:peptidoglycan DL-endopeptidase CwlO